VLDAPRKPVVRDGHYGHAAGAQLVQQRARTGTESRGMDRRVVLAFHHPANNDVIADTHVPQPASAPIPVGQLLMCGLRYVPQLHADFVIRDKRFRGIYLGYQLTESTQRRRQQRWFEPGADAQQRQLALVQFNKRSEQIECHRLEAVLSTAITATIPSFDRHGDHRLASGSMRSFHRVIEADVIEPLNFQSRQQLVSRHIQKVKSFSVGDSQPVSEATTHN
jgi:hypothetical protein